MKKTIVRSVFLFLVYILQSSIFSFLSIRGIKPDFLLAAVIAVALQSSDIEGGIYGLFFGLLQDFHTGYILGINAFSKFITGYLTGYYTRILFKSDILLPFVVTFVGSILHESITIIIMHFIQFSHPFLPLMWKLVLPYAFLNSVICVFIYNILRKIEDSFFKHEGVVGR